MIAVRYKNGVKDDRAYNLVRKALRYWGWTQKDGTGIAMPLDDGVYYVKSDADASEFFRRLDDEDWTSDRGPFDTSDVMIGHVRLACSGSVNMHSAHPFVSTSKCDIRKGQMFALTHNGWLNNTKKLKKELKDKYKLKPETEVDSELLALLVSAVGVRRAPGVLRELKVTGKCNFIVLWDDGTVQVYSHGDIEIFQDDNKVVLATESVRLPGQQYIQLSQWTTLKAGHLATLTRDSYLSIDEIVRVQRYRRNKKKKYTKLVDSDDAWTYFGYPTSYTYSRQRKSKDKNKKTSSDVEQDDLEDDLDYEVVDGELFVGDELCEDWDEYLDKLGVSIATKPSDDDLVITKEGIPNMLVYLPAVGLYTDGIYVYNSPADYVEDRPWDMVKSDADISNDWDAVVEEWRWHNGYVEDEGVEEAEGEDDADAEETVNYGRVTERDIVEFVGGTMVEVFKDDMRHLNDHSDAPMFVTGQNTKAEHKRMWMSTYGHSDAIYEALWFLYNNMRSEQVDKPEHVISCPRCGHIYNSMKAINCPLCGVDADVYARRETD